MNQTPAKSDLNGSWEGNMYYIQTKGEQQISQSLFMLFIYR